LDLHRSGLTAATLVVSEKSTNGDLPFSIVPCSGFTIKFTLRKIDLFSAVSAFMRFVKFIRENFFLCTAMGAIADKRFQVFVVFEPRAMLWCRHRPLLAARRAIGRKHLPGMIDLSTHSPLSVYPIRGSLPVASQSGV
jgi:hypothetical protein